MDYYDIPGAVGMCILLRGTTMGGPTGMTDSCCSGDRPVMQYGFEIGELANTPPYLQLSMVLNRNAGGVVPSIFKTL
jgi:hypothetical protein